MNVSACGRLSRERCSLQQLVVEGAVSVKHTESPFAYIHLPVGGQSPFQHAAYVSVLFCCMTCCCCTCRVPQLYLLLFLEEAHISQTVFEECLHGIHLVILFVRLVFVCFSNADTQQHVSGIVMLVFVVFLSAVSWNDSPGSLSHNLLLQHHLHGHQPQSQQPQQLAGEQLRWGSGPPVWNSDHGSLMLNPPTPPTSPPHSLIVTYMPSLLSNLSLMQLNARASM